ncbi:TPA: phage major capsid protein [Listeria innocua]|uniref:phage major capsid protein n=1 Tax=Listeria innocua TaxID=1642 RepID=UPI002999C264|nr:phage major capsid protein [Listeria innocua]HBM3493447.1 phage major capsid protein [Listeria innocua]HBM3614108.1 phage major capsid protein [Listeria innocua]HBM3635845.1 phage major capsid protein [Listeria innocua]HBM3801123.1 phage major capsid protein [Listeria innocua]HBM4013868.1 phage major capsid protein [Listeria innocua]
MNNLDNNENQKLNLSTAFLNAIKEGASEEEQVKAFSNMAEQIQANIITQARKEVNREMNDNNVLTSRGANALTSDENKYYNAVIAGNGFAGVTDLLPPTVFERVFEDLTVEHPLLSKINFVNTTATTEWIISVGDVATAWWGPLCAEIKEILDNGFDKIQTGMYKLSAYIPVCNAMLDLGPSWLDQYVRTILGEAMALGLEAGIVNGSGKDQPIGMMRDVDNSSTDGHPEKTATPLTDLTPQTLANDVMLPLTDNGKKSVNDAILVINPADYWSKIFAATTYMTPQGAWVTGILPVPLEIIQSVAVPVGKAVAGRANDYFMGIGSEQVIRTSTEYRLLDDETLYYAKQYANGRPKDNTSFLVFDITGLKGSPAIDVNVVNDATPSDTPAE